MKLLTFVTLMLACLCGFAEELSDYRLGSGDLIKITVYEEPDLGLEVKLSDAGTVSYPFLGELAVAGMTLGQLENRITFGLKGDYLVEPNVTISIVEYRRFYVNGEIEAPGGFAYSPGITLRKAIALAGGFTERASRNKMYVIREGVEHSGKGNQIKLNEELAPGDIVTIEQSFF